MADGQTNERTNQRTDEANERNKPLHHHLPINVPSIYIYYEFLSPSPRHFKVHGSGSVAFSPEFSIDEHSIMII